MADTSADLNGHRRLNLRRVVLVAGALVIAAVVGLIGARGFASTASWRLIGNAEFSARTHSVATGFADIVDAVKPAVFGVQTRATEKSSEQRGESPPGRSFGAPHRVPGTPSAPRPGRVVTSQGSGFFISPDGYAVTNHHVVDGSFMVEVQTDDHRTYKAKVVGTDIPSDLALLKVDGRDDFPYVRLADKAPRVGDWVLAIGNPFGLGGTVTAGIVSARERNLGTSSYDNLLQIDAPINKGDSGGPTFDRDGRVIGVNTMIYSPSGGSIGIAFAVPAATVKSVIPQLKDKGSVTRGWLGVQIQDVTRDIAEALGLRQAQGALVADAQADAPAANAGIAPGDVVVSIDGVAVRQSYDLSSRIGAKPPGTSVKLSLFRQGEEQAVTVTIGELPGKRRPSADSNADETTGRAASELRMSLASADKVPGAGDRGVIVVEVDPTGFAAEQGFEPGDLILEVSGKPVNSPDEIRSTLSGARSEGKQTVLMRLKSGETMRFVAVPTG